MAISDDEEEDFAADSDSDSESESPDTVTASRRHGDRDYYSNFNLKLNFKFDCSAP